MTIEGVGLFLSACLLGAVVGFLAFALIAGGNRYRGRDDERPDL